MSYIPFGGVTIDGEVNVTQNENQYDAYGRMRVSNVTTLFESQLIYNKQERLWNEHLVGSATTTFLEAEGRLMYNVTATANDKVIRQSKVYTKAQLGKSHLVFITGNFEGVTFGVEKKIGYFDDANGVFYKVDDSGISLVIRSSVSGTVIDTSIPQTSWNLDQLNGQGKSGLVLDITKDQIFSFDIEWMGTGKVRCGFLIDGSMLYVHEFKFSNADNTSFMKTATLPARFEIENKTGGNAATLKETAVVIMTEGDAKGFVNQFTISNAATPRQVSNSLEPIISIRPKTYFNNQKNRIASMLKSASIFSQDKDIYFEIRLNVTLENPVWIDVNTTSSVEVDLSASSFSGGEIITSGYISANEVFFDKNIDKFSKYLMSTNFDATSSSILTLVAKTLTTTTSDIFSTFIWDEEY